MKVPTDDGYVKVATFDDVFDSVERHDVQTIQYTSMNTLSGAVYMELVGKANRHYGGTMVSSKSFSQLQTRLAGKVKFLPM